jgi:hypothetical protein
MIDELRKLLSDKMGLCKVRGEELIFQECPFCHNNRWNLEVNLRKGVWHDWVCGEGGSIVRLLAALGITYEGKLPSFKEAREASQDERPREAVLPEGLEAPEACADSSKVMGYLGSRGITKEDIKRYEIMWWTSHGRVVFPFRNSAGNLIFWTARTIFRHVRPKYLHAQTSKADKIISFSGLNDTSGVSYIAEGVFDAIRINKEGHTVIMLMGSSISKTAIEHLRTTKQGVVLVLDSDMHKKQMMYEEELKKHLGEDKVKAIYLPEKDVASVGIPEGCEGFSGYVKSRLGKGKQDEAEVASKDMG